MSKDDFDNLGSGGLNPLDGDLLGALGPLPPAGEPGPLDETMALSPELAAAAAAEPAAEAAAGPAVEEKAVEEKAVEEKAEEVVQPEEEEEKGPSFLARLAESNPYTVILVVSLVALLIALCCLLLEWGSYGFDTKAKASQQSASAAAASALEVG